MIEIFSLGSRFEYPDAHRLTSEHLKFDDFYQDAVRDANKSHQKLIVGIGDYSGVDQKQVRCELICRNKFRNQLIDKQSNANDTYNLYSLSVPVAKALNIKLSKGIGNSWCNLFAYQMCRQIEAQKLGIKVAFLHAPVKLSFHDKCFTVDQMIKYWKDNGF